MSYISMPKRFKSSSVGIKVMLECTLLASGIYQTVRVCKCSENVDNKINQVRMALDNAIQESLPNHQPSRVEPHLRDTSPSK